MSLLRDIQIAALRDIEPIARRYEASAAKLPWAPEDDDLREKQALRIAAIAEGVKMILDAAKRFDEGQDEADDRFLSRIDATVAWPGGKATLAMLPMPEAWCPRPEPEPPEPKHDDCRLVLLRPCDVELSDYPDEPGQADHAPSGCPPCADPSENFSQIEPEEP